MTESHNKDKDVHGTDFAWFCVNAKCLLLFITHDGILTESISLSDGWFILFTRRKKGQLVWTDYMLLNFWYFKKVCSCSSCLCGVEGTISPCSPKTTQYLIFSVNTSLPLQYWDPCKIRSLTRKESRWIWHNPLVCTPKGALWNW